ncbi:hypothetical protein VB780_05515 [Leptolyngbya sp. CCNP1308]|uniref:P-loop ATPase, Sll1717 family n=1 Tax=Leptolyngbya sp. CCNP1308 TaxID=3110255 RepID=UPI002B21C0CE|nr:hypothetical protein [Leptolyngbya sp. CCNP1308]MEA5448018.1 hypothetical protein [Leptolyngbya sp. CCNP1308]
MISNQFVFRGNQTIGAAAAEQDGQYLSDCFIDTGILSILLDCEDHRCILVGRTGAGKSALVSQLNVDNEHVIPILPDSLSLSYISNSNVINFFTEAGVNLSLFYKLLWRHVFVVEILRERFKINSEQQKQNFFLSIWSSVTRSRKHEMALKYLQEWGDSFWRETDYRVQEVTSKLEKDLRGAANLSFLENSKLDFSAARKLTKEQREEVIHRGQEVVSKVQIQELNLIVDFLDEILLADRQKKYYIVIDKLDEEWVENKLRFKLIRGLIETSLEFTRLKNVKVIIAIRNDLLDRVYRFTRGEGFQEEKYRTSSLDLIWSKSDLVEVLDRRVNKLVKSQYTKKKVTHNDLMRPVHLEGGKSERAIEYMLKRTLLRPRDLIQYFNMCIALSDGKPMVDASTLVNAEGNYSRDRFRALLDEWIGVYPNMGLLAQILRTREPIFRIHSVSRIEIEEICLQAASSIDAVEGEDLDAANKVVDAQVKAEDYRRELFLLFYKVSLVGIKTNDAMPVSWSYLGGPSVSIAEVEDRSKVFIHPMFWRHFGILSGQKYKM